MFSSSVIKGPALKHLEVASVRYDQLVNAEEESHPDATCEGFAPLTFTGGVLGEAPSQADESGTPPLASEPPPLPDNSQVVDRDELQQQLDHQYRIGQEEGREQAERGLANVFKALRQGIADLTGLRDKVLRESEEDLLKLAIMVARKVIQQEISLNPQILSNIVAAAITDCSGLERITIRLNPADYAVVAADRQGYFGTLCPDVQLTLTPDDTVSQGGCVVDTTTGTIDARIETQLDEIFRRFMEDRTFESGGAFNDTASQNAD